MRAERFPDIYAYVLLRTLQLSRSDGRCGMIVPLSVTFSEDFANLRERLCSSGETWFSSFDNIPAALFEGVSQRCTIWIGGKSVEPHTFVSPMYRWRSEYRTSLLVNTSYAEVTSSGCGAAGIPKLSSETMLPVLVALAARPGGSRPRVSSKDPRNIGRIGFSQSARNFVSAFLEVPPCLDEKSLQQLPASKIGYVKVRDEDVAKASLAILVGETFMWYWLTRGDGFDVTSWIVADFLAGLNQVRDDLFQCLVHLGDLVHSRRFEALVFKKNARRYVGNYNYRGHFAITRRADLALLAGIGADRDQAQAIFEYVQRVLSINVFAGEKAIPSAVKAQFSSASVDTRPQNKLFQETDSLLRKAFGYSEPELDFIFNHDVSPASVVAVEE